MAEQDDFVSVIDDEEGEGAASPHAVRWKVAIIDDDPAVHDGTRFALSDYVLNGHGIEILSAYSAADGRELLRAHPDTAVVLLDVVMEAESSGLELVDIIRNQLKNETVRIILRTGQPGQAPERRVIVDYDINDYKAKTELTADKLFTTLTSALRSYQQLHRMVETRRGLEIIIDAASRLFDFRSMQRLAEGVLTQIASLLNVECAGILVLRDEGEQAKFSILAGSGCYSRFVGKGGPTDLDPALLELVQHANASLEERVQQRTRELTQANERLAAQSEQLRHANRFKSEILGTVAHDLKNPLGVILGRAEMLSELLAAKPLAKDAAAAQIGHIRDSAKRLTEMVDTLIADAMSDALDIQIRKEPIDLGALVAEVAGANRTLADRKEQTIKVGKAPEVTLLGDHDRLAEALDNLISNAIKYSPKGSAIDVAIARKRGQASIRVKDKGPGLSREDMSRLFGRFQRLSARPTGGETSTGLGLSIAKRIVELHGGTIEAVSEGQGRGAVFEILLPTERWVE